MQDFTYASFGNEAMDLYRIDKTIIMDGDCLKFNCTKILELFLFAPNLKDVTCKCYSIMLCLVR